MAALATAAARLLARRLARTAAGRLTGPGGTRAAREGAGRAGVLGDGARLLRSATADGRGRRVALDAVGRILWLGYCAGGAVLGWLLAAAASGVTGAEGTWAPLAGVFGGMAWGSQRGWHRRLRLAGVPVSAWAQRLGTALLLAALVAGTWLDLR